MSKSKVFIGFAICFGAGVLIASKFDIYSQWVYVFLAACALGLTFSFFIEKKTAAVIALFLFCAGLGALRLQASMVQNQYTDILDSKQQLEGYVTEDPDVRSNTQLITFRPKGRNQEILITTTLAQSFFYGDWVVAEGKVEPAKNFSDFDYQKYLERHNIYATLRYPKILILKSHQLNPIKEFLLKIKHGFSERLSEVLKEPQRSLAQGILIGGHGTLPKNIVDNFNATGTSHIIAVSGFNITIIVIALASLAYVVGRRISFWLASFAIIGFVIITGGSASVVRAAVMGFLLLLALNIGRQYSIVPSLFFAGLIMLIANPKILYWDVGFQLSFAATLGIIYFLPLLESFTQKIPVFTAIKILVLTTLSAIVATLPIILFNFGTLSLSAPIVNVLILPFVPLAMLLGFLSILPFLGAGFALAANILLVYIIKTIGFFAGLPYSSLNIEISAWIFYLLCLAVFALYFGLRSMAGRISRVEEIVSL